MAMEISNAYGSNVSNTAYAVKNNNQKQTTGSNETEKTGSEINSPERKTAADELSYLSKKYGNCSFVAANYSKGMQYGSSSTTNIAISPQFLTKMANDPKLEAEYEGYIEDLQRLDQEFAQMKAASGWRVAAQGWAIDKDGGISGWAIVTKDPNAKSHLQTMSENAEKIREQNAEKKKQQKEIEEKRQADKGEKAELKEKLQEAGKAQFDDKFKDAIIIMEDELEEASSRKARVEETAAGSNLDTTI